MGPLEFILIATSTIALGSTLGMIIAMARSAMALKRSHSDRDRAVMAEAATSRALRMSVSDLRADAMKLLGYSERLVIADSQVSSDVKGIISITRRILDQCDDMQDYSVPTAASRRLEPETLALKPLIDDVIASVAATLSPGTRHWEISSALDHINLFADRRGVAFIVARVLSNAARHSRHNETINVYIERHALWTAFVIEDQGAGLLMNRQASSFVDRERRGVGIGLGLVLARVLMEAHGGQLCIESVAQVGTKVTLLFPASRVSSSDEMGSARMAA